MRIYIDIDNTICGSPDTTDYRKSVPWPKAIQAANDLYDAGNEITYWTARGAKTGIDWRELTVIQLAAWGVKYHALEFGKPDFDMLIDDKAHNAKGGWPW